MHILFLTARLPYPPNRGDRLRVFHFIRELSRQHRITLLSFIEDEDEVAHLAGLRPYCDDIHLVHLSKRQSTINAATHAWRSEPMQAMYYQSAAMQKAVDSLIARQDFDLLYVHLFRMAPFVAQHTRPYRVLDLTDVISAEIMRELPYMGWRRRALYRHELPRIRRYEQTITGQFDETWVISEAERATLAASGAQGEIVVVPNGVDSERYHPIGQRRDRPTLLFVGHMSVPHNEDAAEHLVRDIFPLIRREIPAARLQLVGTDPSARVKRLGTVEGVTVLGHVPDLNAVLNKAAVFLAPLRFAAGVQNKVLEAMAAGTPVVTTSLVNAGIGAEDGDQLLIADSAEFFATQTVTLLQDHHRANQLADAARAFVLDTYRWEAVGRRVAEIASLRG